MKGLGTALITPFTTDGKIDNIITQLINRKCIPEGTKSYSFEIEGKTAKIDLSADFEKALEREIETLRASISVNTPKATKKASDDQICLDEIGAEEPVAEEVVEAVAEEPAAEEAKKQ